MTTHTVRSSRVSAQPRPARNSRRQGVGVGRVGHIVLGALLLLPLYFDVASRTTNISAFILRPPEPLAQAVHSSVFAVAAIGLISARTGTTRLWRFDHLRQPARSLFVIGSAFVVANYFWAVVQHGTAASTDRFLQTAIVFAPLFLVPNLRLDPRRIRSVVLLFSTIGLGVILGYVLLNFPGVSLSGVGRFAIADAFPQILVYLPFLAVIGLVAAVTFTDEPLALRFAAAGTSLGFLAINYSRTGLILAAVSLFFAGFMVPRPQNGRRRGGRFRTGMLSIVALGAALYLGVAGAVGERATAQGLSGGRRAIVGESLSLLAGSPITGQGFSPYGPDHPKPFDSHNQLLELLQRGGLLGGTCLALAIVAVSFQLLRAARIDDEWRDIRVFALVVLVASLVGGLSNTYLTQPFPGIFVWFIVGLGLSNGVQQPRRE